MSVEKIRCSCQKGYDGKCQACPVHRRDRIDDGSIEFLSRQLIRELRHSCPGDKGAAEDEDVEFARRCKLEERK